MDDVTSNRDLMNSNMSWTNKEYATKKQSVIYFYGKILYGCVIFLLIGYGIYFLFLSSKKQLTAPKDSFVKKSAEWNKTYRTDFSDYKVSVINSKGFRLDLEESNEKMHKYEDAKYQYYNPLQFELHNAAALLDDIEFKKSYVPGTKDAYNLTMNLTLLVKDNYDQEHKILVSDIDVFVKTMISLTHDECAENKGLWSYETRKCYRYYQLKALCLIIDQDHISKGLYHNYKKFKCNGFNDWYESHTTFPWVISSYDPNFDDLRAANRKIFTYVSTNRDPYVFALYNGTLHFGNDKESYSIAGIWLIASAFALLIIPIFIYCKEKNEELEQPANYPAQAI